ncbi:MAG TPA: thiol-disulfide oxidoreductase DCC family protein [Gemmatimonadaceae bacterium]|jgi:predicted DCC family thiol-disulfide oxidoreductase YuxK|nr:thiol-disulfide oxidoreductase DCC family protein [Gemmatimonadaceae bacterium]
MTQPTAVEHVEARAAAHDIVLFDGVCNLCTGSVLFILRRDPEGRYRFASLQSEPGSALARQYDIPAGELTSVVLIEGGRAYQRSDAALRIARRLRGGWRALWLLRFVPRVIRDAAYDVVARNRYQWFGRQESCMIPTAELRARFLDG